MTDEERQRRLLLTPMRDLTPDELQMLREQSKVEDAMRRLEANPLDRIFKGGRSQIIPAEVDAELWYTWHGQYITGAKP